MPSQRQIEDAAGIDEAVARHMMAEKTAAARTAMGLLRIQSSHYEAGGFALLQQAVADCKAELNTAD